MMHSCGWVEIDGEKVLLVAPPRHPDGDGKTGEPPFWRRSHVDGLEIHWGLHHRAAVHRLCSKSRAGRPRRSVRNRVNSRKCRPGIKTMCAGYRAFRSPWSAVQYGDAPGRPFPGALRDPELQPRERNLQCLPARFDAILLTCSTNWC